MRTQLISITFAVLFMLSSPAQAAWVEDQVDAFILENGVFIGVTIEGDSQVYRLCLPTRPGMDTNHYLYDLLKRSHQERKPVRIDFSDRGVDSQTNTRKYCIDRVIYR